MENENFHEENCDCKAKLFYEKFKGILEPLLEVETDKSSDSSQDIHSIVEMIYNFEKTPQVQKDNSEDEKDERHQENSSVGSKEDFFENSWQHFNEDLLDHPSLRDRSLQRSNPISISSTRTIRLKKKKLETPSNISLSSRDDILEKIRMNPLKKQSQFLYEFLHWYKDTREQKDDDSDDSINSVKEEIILKLMDKYGDLLSFKSSTNSIENFENYPETPDKNPDLENTLKEIDELKNALLEIEKIAGPIKISRKGKYLIKVTKPKSIGSGKSPRKSPKDEKELGKVDLLKSDSESEESDEIVINLENLDQGDSNKDLSLPGPSGAQKILQDENITYLNNKKDDYATKKDIKDLHGNSKDSFKDYFEIDSNENIQRSNKDDFLPSVFQDSEFNPRGTPLPETLQKKIFSGFDLEKTQYIDPEPVPTHFFEESMDKKDEKDENLSKNEKSILEKELQLLKLEKKLRKSAVKQFILDQSKKGRLSGRKKSSTKSLLKFPEHILTRSKSLPDISRTSNVNEIYRIGLEDCHYPKHQFLKGRTSDSNLRRSCESCFKDSNMSLLVRNNNLKWSRKYKVSSVDLAKINSKRMTQNPSGSSRITDRSTRTREVDFSDDIEFDQHEDEYSNFFRNEVLTEIDKIIENAHSIVSRRSNLLKDTNLYHFSKLNRRRVDSSPLSLIKLGALSMFPTKNSLESLSEDKFKNFVMPSLSKYLKDSERHANCGCPSINGADSFWNKNEKNDDDSSVDSVKISIRSEDNSGSTNNDYTLSCLKSDQEILKEYLDSVRSSEDPEPEKLKKKEINWKNDTKRMKDAKIYLEEHKIQDLCHFLNTHLLTFLPDEPVQFLIDLLDRCLKYRIFGSSEVIEPPLLFQRRHVESLFKSMAPHNRKYITYKQYKIGMLTLNLKNYNTAPEMTSEGCISRDTFVKEALMTMTKNFMDIIRPSETKRQFCTKTVSTDSLKGFFSFKNFSTDSASTFLTGQTGPSDFTMD